MGWSGGSAVTGTVVRELKKRKVPAVVRKVFYEVLIPALEDHDWDNADEVFGDDPALDEVLKKLHPNWEFD